ncbi:MAG: glucose-6-phosphate isomerase [Clostridia bacterium]|nr:glucose-6-phosphate isomerase [Clostridia bacterium]
MSITVNTKYVEDFISKMQLASLKKKVKECHDMLHNKTGEGAEFTGWVDLPVQYDKEEFEKIKIAAEKIKRQADILIVIGIGGSYLGARAVIDMFKNPFRRTNKTEVIFLGNQISSEYMTSLLYHIVDKDIAVNVISKSGTTTEPAIAFRILKDFMERKYGKEYAKTRIYATTDKEKGALRKLAETEGYETFTIPDDVGGRFSVLTAVGLLPIAVADVDIDELMEGAALARELYNQPDNEAYKYAIYRNALYKIGKKTEIMVNYEPHMHYFTEWWKQLFGESEGKDHKGIFPAGVDFTTDLHSMGQYIQEGRRDLFETVLHIKNSRAEFIIKEDKENLDGLNFLAGKSMNEINEKAMQGTVIAHYDGNAPSLIVDIDEITPKNVGELIYFFEKACGISGYLLGVNPFNQPGVEEYKKNMFALLGKPGYEEKKKELEARMKF